jgi:uroporphyrinogen decarboxylase
VNFQGQTVLLLESRMAVPMQRLVEKLGGKALVAPALKEIPLSDNAAAFAFFERLEKGEFDLFILMTGVGIRTLLKILETRYPKERVLRALAQTKVVVRGPKPTAVCKMSQIPIAVTVPPPNTWQEILQILSDESLLGGKKVALLEYGRSDPHFIAELSGRGAQVFPVQVYSWGFPEDTAPLKRAVQEILSGRVDLLLITSAIQLDHLLGQTASAREELALRRALHRVGIFSIGPTTSAHLREKQIFPDFEVFPNKWEHLIEEAARQGTAVLKKKRERADRAWARVEIKEAATRNPVANSPLLKACRRERNETIPIWLMRQAGRYMEEYQLVRQGVDFLTLCKTPELAAQVTLDAVERLGVDAAIIFSDILVIVEPMGVPLEFRESLGPVIAAPVRTEEAVDALRAFDPREELAFVGDAVRLVRKHLHPRIPLIGFAGAPFTVAAYMIEGKGSRHYVPTKVLMHDHPQVWHRLLEKLTTATIDYLRAQAEAGCQVLQVFDSWVGSLSQEDYRRFVLPHTRRLFAELPRDVPTIHFGTDSATLLELQKEAGGDVIGLDWRVDIASAWDRLANVGVQGNLDPVLLFAEPKVFLAEAQRILESVGSRPGFIFNLGHGILPETPVEHVMELVDFVHGWKANLA